MKLIITLVGLAAVLTAGCAGMRDQGGLPSSRGILTAEEIANTSALNAYDAIQMRRPAFLAPRSRQTIDGTASSTVLPVVYLNGIYYGDVGSLRDIRVSEIHEIRYLDPKEATLMYGTGHVAGAIVVVTKFN